MGAALTGMERRVTLQLLSYWEKIRAGRPMPIEQDIDPDDIRDLWDRCFLIHTKDLAKADYNYTYLGEAIVEAYNHGLAKDEGNGLVSPNAGKLASSYEKVVQSHKPLLEEGEFPNLHAETIKYRQCLLPLGKDGRIDAIFGGMSFKIFP